MVIMALDHVRDFFHNQASVSSPTDMATTTPVMFFTRWITHFCAPTFVFLAGTSAFLAGRRKTRKALSGFLIKRGLWLILVELVLVTFAWTFNPLFNILIFQVIWAIGISMVILGCLVLLPVPVILAIGLLIVFGHNAFDHTEAVKNGHAGWLFTLANEANFSFFPFAQGRGLMVAYAFLPWTGVMCLGYCFGRFFGSDVSAGQRQRMLLVTGALATLLFVVLRYINQYGDPAPWHVQRNATYTFLSFLNTTKYPPSLMYLLMTLGPAIMLLGLVENLQGRASRFFITYGRVPFFYYVCHLYLIHLICVAAFFLTGYNNSQIVPAHSPFFFRPDNFGFPLWGVYLIWAGVVLLLYPACRWYNHYKSTHHQWWLSYL